MTRINTNVSSMNAQKTLGRANAQLQEAMTRLSTGLRINSGKDDPAGLIASEMMRSDITSTQRAITNSERANQMIATADSALSQVSTLLIEVRGLVTEAANEGALSTEQIAANQLQVDAALESLNRIAQITNFQGRKLLDGSLDFITTAGANFEKAGNLEIKHANLGTLGQMGLTVDVTQAATQAQIDIDVPGATPAQSAHADFVIGNTAVQATGDFVLDAGAGDTTITVTATADGRAAGADGNDINVVIVDDDGGDSEVYDAGTNTITITRDITGGGITAADIVSAIESIEDGGVADFTASASDVYTLVAGDAGTHADVTAGGRDAGSATIRITADTAGADANGIEVLFVTSGDALGASIDVDGNIVVNLNDSATVTYDDIRGAIDGLADYSATFEVAPSGDDDFIGGTDTAPSDGALAGGAEATEGLTHDVVFSLTGQEGAEMFSFSAGTTIDQMQSAISLLNDSTGVRAEINGTTLELISNAYGSESFVDVKLVAEDPAGTITAAVGQGQRQVGTDIEGRINGTEATGRGNDLSLDTATLAISMNVEADYVGDIGLTISGGGAMFQIGPQVVSNQQARIGIGSVNTASLGGVSGRLYQLGSGQDAALANDAGKAARIVEEVIAKVTTLQGRLGAFQKTTLDSNIASLNDTLENLVAAESSIRDADFAVEAAAMTRAQILVQSGTTVLSIANQNPQNVLALLR